MKSSWARRTCRDSLRRHLELHFTALLYRGDLDCILPAPAFFSEVTMNSRNSRNGLILFAVYLLFYGGFVVINAFDPASMERTPIAGLNLAVLYGFGLIIGAVVLSAIYGVLCGDASGNSSGSDHQEPKA